MRRENSRLLRVTIGLTAILIIFALAGEKFDPGRVFLDRLAGTFNPADNGSRGRLLLWKAALRLGMREPLLGVGPMRFAPAASDLLAREITNIPHNTYLGAFAETGLCGLAALIWFPVLLAARLGRRALGGDAPAALLLFALGGTAVQAFTINVENMRFLWLLLAFIYVRTEQPGPEGAVVGFGYGAAGRERSGSAPGEMRR